MDSKIEAILDAILDGQSMREALATHGLSAHAFQKRLAQDRSAALAYARALEIRADLLADEALHIADTNTDAALARNQIDIRKWLASKLHARQYGDRIDLNVTQTIDVSATLAEARARLLPTRYLAPTIEGQALEITSESLPELSDKQSPTDEEPDIFS